MTIIKKHHAWAIRTNSPSNDTFLGRYWWFGNESPHPIKPQHQGCQIGLFRTRREALEALNKEKANEYRSYPKSKVVKVWVTIEEGK